MMSFAQPKEPDSTNLVPTLIVSPSLSSNNPFRNRATSPSSPAFPSSSSPTDLSFRPSSRNPFLEITTQSHIPAHTANPEMSVTADKSKEKSMPSHSSDFADFFNNLSFDNKPEKTPTIDKKISTPKPSAVPNSQSKPTPEKDRKPSQAPMGHRLTKSQEEALRARRTVSASPNRSRPTRELDIFADPPNQSRKSNERRPKRNSVSSIKGSPVKSLTPEDEKKRQERRRRERKLRERDEKDPKSRKPNHKLDVIDKLDVTSIYGTGLFHHDGPFDACNPHRNRRGSKRAPMKAFPKDSLNNVLGGGGPINKRPDHATFLGNNDEEAFKDYSKGGSNYGEFELYTGGVNGSTPAHIRRESNVVSATTRVEPIHGEETLGLGTSTFLEGAPASKTAMQRRKSESPPPENNLSRSKSLAKKIRGINVPRREHAPWLPSPDFSSPEARTFGATKADRRSTDSEVSKGGDPAHAKKDSVVVIVEPEKPSIHNRENGHRTTGPPDYLAADAPGEMLTAKTSSGFLNRVKSLKAGPRKVKSSLIES
ncbi:hypothetical protein K3495_g6483 [Podosphaera aphanis]|nr:hypothetical protein K3495_g6483 [Podosphaera aphanis]